MIKSISDTKFFKLLKKVSDRDQRRTYWGRIGLKLVESEQRIIVYDSRGVIHSTDSVEDATSFFSKEKATGRFMGGMYLHSGKEWVPLSDKE